MGIKAISSCFYVGLLAGCADSATQPDSAMAPVFAPGGTGVALSEAHVVMEATVNSGTAAAPVWIDTRLDGDGRDRFGQASAAAGDYQGGHCGVRTIVYDQRPVGGVTFDPDTYYDAASMSGPCGAPRSLVFDLGSGPISSAAQVRVPELWQFSAGETRLLVVSIGGPGLPCQLWFDASATGSNRARATRLPDGAAGVRRWLVESQGNHRAACLSQNPKSGKLIDTGTRYYLPFAMTVTQVPPPGSSYP